MSVSIQKVEVLFKAYAQTEIIKKIGGKRFLRRINPDLLLINNGIYKENQM